MECKLSKAVQKAKLKVSLHADDTLVMETFDVDLWNDVLARVLQIMEFERLENEMRGVQAAPEK